MAGMNQLIVGHLPTTGDVMRLLIPLAFLVVFGVCVIVWLAWPEPPKK